MASSVSLELPQRGKQGLDGGKVQSQLNSHASQVGQQQLIILAKREHTLSTISGKQQECYMFIHVYIFIYMYVHVHVHVYIQCRVLWVQIPPAEAHFSRVVLGVIVSC